MKERDRLHVQVVERAFRLLEAFASAPHSYSLAQLAAASDMDKTSAQRLVHTLTGLGYLERDAAGLRPGARLLERAADFTRWDRLTQTALPLLTELNRHLGEAIDLSRFDGLSMLYVLRLQSRHSSYHAQIVGQRVPTYCTSMGCAVLSALPEAEALAILEASDRRPLTRYTITEIDALMDHVRRARAQGHSVMLQQFKPGEIGLSAPVLGTDGRPVAAVRVAGSLGDWTAEEFARRYAPGIMQAADAIGRLLP